MSHTTALWVSLGLLLGNAFFVGAEFAAMAARRSALEPLAAAGSARAATCLAALEQMGSMLATAQLGITVCSVGLGALAESALHDILLPIAGLLPLGAFWVDALALAGALFVVVYLHVVAGEMIPKNLALAGPERSALLLVPALLFVSRVLRPLVAVMEGLSKSLVRLIFRIEPKDEIASAFTADEVGHILAESGREGLIGEGRQGLVRSALEFSVKRAADVCVPTGRLVTVVRGATPEDVERLVAQTGFSRYPFVDKDGQIAGYLHLKDVLYAADSERRTAKVPRKRLRRLATVGPGDEIEDVLATMQRNGSHLARVVEQDGRVSGVVFLEDVIEELIGTITDAEQR
ncbi:MAG: hemolysin family protein [Candidatus Phosphoribacter sp.]